MKLLSTPEEVRAEARGRMGLVPTLGALHEGHLSLVAAVRHRSDTVVLSIFVNPLQFDRPGDLEAYPRDQERDLALAEQAGVDVVFAPPTEVMYPTPPLTAVSVREITDSMEGARRPGHFAGVATVVTKLLAGLRPDLATFGRKDHQQLILVRRLVRDLSFPVELVACPTVREPDGLALSSRNAQLTDRAAALSISQGLFAAAEAVADGVRSGERLEAIVGERLQLDSVDYVTLASQELARPLPVLDRPAFLALAGWAGDVRLIDNLPLDLVGEMFVPDRGTMLDVPSRLATR